MNTEESEVLFRNRQWIVDEDGMETVESEPSYYFEADRLTETTIRPEGRFYDWSLQLAEKTWVDIEAFLQAFTKALELHAGKYDPPLDRALLARSLERARRDALQR